MRLYEISLYKHKNNRKMKLYLYLIKHVMKLYGRVKAYLMSALDGG
jgi:hypothetical protein